MSPKRATRDDVARLAGTSNAVVSYVVNDGPRNVSDHLRQRVLAAMATLNYFPNALARSLGSTESGTIGMIVPNISNAYFSELALEVENAAIGRGQLLFLGNANEDSRREIAYLRHFVERRVDGIVIIGVAHVSTLEIARRASIPVVVVDRDLDQDELPTVSINHRAAAREATEHLLQHGHRHIACLAGPADQPVAEERRIGWEDALHAAGLEPRPESVFRSEFSVTGGRGVAAEMLRHCQTNDITAAFISSDDQARGVIAGANEATLSVPRDLALVSVDGTREGQEVSPPLTTMMQPFSSLAEAAVNALSADVHLTGHQYLAAALRIGQSCGCGGKNVPPP